MIQKKYAEEIQKRYNAGERLYSVCFDFGCSVSQYYTARDYYFGKEDSYRSISINIGTMRQIEDKLLSLIETQKVDFLKEREGIITELIHIYTTTDVNNSNITIPKYLLRYN